MSSPHYVITRPGRLTRKQIKRIEATIADYDPDASFCEHQIPNAPNHDKWWIEVPNDGFPPGDSDTKRDYTSGFRELLYPIIGEATP